MLTGPRWYAQCSGQSVLCRAISWCQDAICQRKLWNPRCKHCVGHLTTEIVPNNWNEIGSRHYMSAEISSPSPPVLGIFRFHKTWVGISMTHSPVIHLSLLYLWHCHKRLKIRIFSFCLRGEFIISSQMHLCSFCLNTGCIPSAGAEHISTNPSAQNCICCKPLCTRNLKCRGTTE